MSVCSTIGGGNFDCLVKVAYARFLSYKVTVFHFVISDLEGGTWRLH